MDGEPLARLREFGLSEYASRAYLALLQVGSGDARTLARLAKVPIAKIYSTLDQLQARGLARMIVETPKRFEPIPFEDFLAQLRQTHLREAERIADLSPKLAPLFAIRSEEVPSDRGSLTILRGRRNVLAKYHALASEATEEIFLVLTEGAGKRASSSRSIFDEAAQRRVPVRAMAPLHGPNHTIFAAMSGWADIRSREEFDVRDGAVGYGIFDSRIAFVTHFVPDDGNVHNGHDFGILITEQAIVHSLLDLLEGHWRRAAQATAQIGGKP
ncbi:MAG: HTH-type transcriptional regulator, sugar sensing transcriptional regulator [Thermoplasmata archaeon]|jgi:sugar-specific transcriptional regulator TrmB|nr:HTH-type transcriptional regulator, sugar sensing transcriptional regulator [Thermoplasmata archaeon]